MSETINTIKEILLAFHSWIGSICDYVGDIIDDDISTDDIVNDKEWKQVKDKIDALE